MTTLTIDIDDRLIEALREAAARRHTTIDAVVAERVEPLASEGSGDEDWLVEARETLRELMATSTARLGPDYKWNREELYADRVFPRHERPGLRSDGEEG